MGGTNNCRADMVITSLGSDEAVESVANELLAGQEVCDPLLLLIDEHVS